MLFEINMTNPERQLAIAGIDSLLDSIGKVSDWNFGTQEKWRAVQKLRNEIAIGTAGAAVRDWKAS